jgi:CrcB protein
VAIGGTVGSLVRWGLVGLVPPERAGLTTFGINVAGSLFLGALIGRRERMDAERLLALGTGFAGGLTTFSSYAVAVATDLEDGALADAAANGLGTPVAALLAAGIGYRAMRMAVTARSARRRARAERVRAERVRGERVGGERVAAQRAGPDGSTPTRHQDGPTAGGGGER